MMIDMQPINRALCVIAASQSLVDSVPISACLIAESDTGKSATLLSHLPDGARILDDMTTASLIQVLDSDPRPKVLVLPDLNQAISHRPSVVRLLMSALLSLMGEGLTEIPGVDKDTPFKLKADELRAGGVRVAVLTGLTPQMFFAQRAHWRNIGLLRRLTPIFYCYPSDTIEKIQKKIMTLPSGRKIETYPRVELPPVKPGAPDVPAVIAREIEIMSREIILTQLVWQHKHPRSEDSKPVRALALPFSIHKVLRTYTRAHALLNHRHKVTDADLEALKDFARFVRYDRAEEV